MFEQTVSDDGKTRVRERYTVFAPLAGRLERIRLKAGDPVEQGQVVALLTPVAPALLDARSVRELQARVGAAEAQQLRAKAEVARVMAQRDQAQADSRPPGEAVQGRLHLRDGARAGRARSAHGRAHRRGGAASPRTRPGTS